MRTAMPLVTCSKITLLAPSANSLSISTPRLIGPGCMMIALGLSQPARVLLSPKRPVYSPRDGNMPAVWRSCCIRRSMTTSASERAERRSWETVTPSGSNVRGTKVDGPTMVTLAPNLTRAWMLERATRLKRMSPRMTTLRPLREPRCSRMVNVSSRPCVGCSWEPSPALMTGMPRILER